MRGSLLLAAGAMLLHRLGMWAHQQGLSGAEAAPG